MDLCWPELKPHPSVSPESLLRVVVSMNNVFITVYWLEREYVTSGFWGGEVVLVARQGRTLIIRESDRFCDLNSKLKVQSCICGPNIKLYRSRLCTGAGLEGENTLEPGNSQDESVSARSINADQHQLSKPADHSCDYSRWRQKKRPA